MPETKKAVVVTGGSGGIGKAVIDLLSETYEVCLNLDINPPELDEHFVATDIGNIEDVKKSVEFFSQFPARLKGMILCAGIGIHEKLTEGDPVKWKRVIETNLLGPLNVLRAYLPFMSEGGDVVFISSVAASQPYEYGGVYAATKAALNMVAHTLRLEVENDIRVTIVEPGLVSSDFMKNTLSGARDENGFDFEPLHPKIIANAVKYILDQPNGISINEITLRPSGQKF